MKHVKVLVGLFFGLIVAAPLAAQTVNSNAGAIVGTVTVPSMCTTDAMLYGARCAGRTVRAGGLRRRASPIPP